MRDDIGEPLYKRLIMQSVPNIKKMTKKYVANN